jgi:hypothetical protein
LAKSRFSTTAISGPGFVVDGVDRGIVEDLLLTLTVIEEK